MRNAALFASAALLLVTTIPAGAQQSRASSRGSVMDAHEGLTVTAEPWTSAEQYKEKFHKKSPLDAGIIAIRVSFRNDTNESIRIALSRIRLSFNLDENNHQELPPMKSEDVADAILKPGGKDPTASRSRIPLREAVGSLPPGLRMASATSSDFMGGNSWWLFSSRLKERRIRLSAIRMLSFVSLRKETRMAMMPASKGDFLWNFSLYCSAEVQGSAVTVSPS